MSPASYDTPGNATQSQYNWLRACGYTHADALHALETRHVKARHAGSSEAQQNLFTNTKKGETK